MRKYSPNRRHDTSDQDKCHCGYSRRQKKWVRNGCKRHPVEEAARILASHNAPDEPQREKL